MKIVFAGSLEKGYFIEEVATRQQLESTFIESSIDIHSQVANILKEENVAYIIYDISQYGNQYQEIAEVIAKIFKANNAKPIIFAEGYNPKMAIIRQLYYNGIDSFIFSHMLADKKTDLEQCILGTNSLIEYADEEEVKQEKSNGGSAARTIGIAGAIRRMGTTTQAIQFVKYLLFKGYKACFIQMNNHEWVQELKDAYENVEHDEEMGRVTYQSVDMYYRLDKLSEVLKKEYDFFVYDYGVYSDRDFNKISFLEKDLQVFVVGTKPGEFVKTYKLVENNFYSRCCYIFNYIPNDEIERRETTFELMKGKEDATFFAEDCRDQFVFSGSDIYEKMVPLDSKTDVKHVKRGFFRKRKR